MKQGIRLGGSRRVVGGLCRGTGAAVSGVTIGAAYRPWGWGVSRFGWADHVVIVNNQPWRRTWVNRGGYVHPYEAPRYAPERRVEGHELHERTERERDSYRGGGERYEEHDRRR